MIKFAILHYQKQTNVPIKYLPIDLYFLQERIQKEVDGLNEGDKISKDKLNESVYPEMNMLKKYDYCGTVIYTFINPMSQIINNEKFIKIEEISE